MAQKRVVESEKIRYFCSDMEDVLDKNLVSDTSICNLLLRIGKNRLDVAIYSVVHDNSLIYRTFALGQEGEGELRSLENVVYDNPLLLSEFRRTFCLIDTGDAMAVPAEAGGPEEAALIFRAAHPGFEGEILTSPTATRNAILVAGVPTELAGFLRRTFHGISPVCHLSPLSRYFASRPGRGNSNRMICNFRPDAMDAIVLHGTDLLLANTFSYKSPMDAAYYIMAVRNALHLDASADELLLAGSQAVRNEITPLLRRFIGRVMPVIFPPQMFRTGKESLHTPFDLIIAPICE